MENEFDIGYSNSNDIFDRRDEIKHITRTSDFPHGNHLRGWFGRL